MFSFKYFFETARNNDYLTKYSAQLSISRVRASRRKRGLRFFACLCKKSSYLLSDLITLTVGTFDSRHRIKLPDRKKYSKLLAAFVAHIVVFRHVCPPMQSYLFFSVHALEVLFKCVFQEGSEAQSSSISIEYHS